MRLMDRFRQWMVGRYGSDQLNVALLVLYLLCSVITSFTGWIVLLVASYALILLVFYRMFSKNISKRYEENQKFMKVFAPVRNQAIKKSNQSAKQRADKAHKYFRCKNCGQMIRVPRGKGKIAITCPRCRQEFIKRT